MATSLAHRLAVVESSEPEKNSSADVSRARSYAEQAEVCTFCYGSGMEVVPGKGARKCRCRNEDRRVKLFEAANIPRRPNECSLENYKPAKGNS
jgi:NADH pyrophosphatase NudC (nudix superfamily)